MVETILFGISVSPFAAVVAMHASTANRTRATRLDRVTNAGDSTLQVAPEQSDKGTSAPGQLWPPHSARAARMIGAITFHPVKDISERIGTPGGARERLLIHPTN